VAIYFGCENSLGALTVCTDLGTAMPDMVRIDSEQSMENCAWVMQWQQLLFSASYAAHHQAQEVLQGKL
jgi:hypothetical protein